MKATDRCVLGPLAPLALLLLAGCGAHETPRSLPDPGALVRAAAGGDVRSVKRLLEAGADPNAADADGRTAVTHAAYGGHAEVVRMLLDGGADVDRRDALPGGARRDPAVGPRPDADEPLRRHRTDPRRRPRACRDRAPAARD